MAALPGNCGSTTTSESRGTDYFSTKGIKMQDNGYMMTAEERERLAEMMTKHENPQVPDKEMRQQFHDSLRKKMWRKNKFSDRGK